ncbi:MAG: hypothetical protein HY343_02800 [Lentisphaerae bacterium]|nr:hypothetical protein [Lentisphaerota bacterium]
MDTIAHALYGATLFSRSGLAGGVKGAVDGQGRRPLFDWTAWAAFGFGILPDLSSIGLYFNDWMGHVAWGLLPPLWLAIWLWRRRKDGSAQPRPPQDGMMGKALHPFRVRWES